MHRCEQFIPHKQRLKGKSVVYLAPSRQMISGKPMKQSMLYQNSRFFSLPAEREDEKQAEDREIACLNQLECYDIYIIKTERNRQGTFLWNGKGTAFAADLTMQAHEKSLLCCRA